MEIRQGLWISFWGGAGMALQADGLAVKDTNFLGIPTSSDPYIEVRFKPAGPATPEGDVQFLGKTPVIRKTVAPKWDGLPPFTCQMPIDKLKQDACFELTVMVPSTITSNSF